MKIWGKERTLPAVSKSEAAGYVILLILGFVLLAQFANDRADGIRSAKSSFALRQDADARAVSNEVNEAFLQMYQGLRTIARLPGVRKLGTQFQFLTDDARISAQEIYNNLSENLSVSELYIVPADFDPSTYEPNSTKSRSPLITFDDLIVGRNADQASKNSAVEEIEIFEYRTMKAQIDTFRERYPYEAKISGLAYPAMASSEVITCDNSRYAPSAPNDDDRKGIVYSIPFYSVDGAFRGIVTAVVLSSVIVEHLPDGLHALSNANYGMTLGAKSGGLWKDHFAAATSGAAHENLAYSKITPLSFPDVTAGWTLWSGAPSAAISASSEVRSIHAHFRDQVAVLLLGLTMVAAALRWQADRHRSVQRLNVDLEKRIADRTEALAIAKHDAEFANAAKSHFLARVSHEVRTPIHAIMSAAELLRSGRSKNLDAAKVGIIMSSSRALLDLVNQVLDLSSIEQGRMDLVLEPFAPEDLAHGVCEMLQANAQQKKLALTSSFIGPPALKVLSDPRRIRQVLINLVGNAIKYTSDGEVEIRAELLVSGDNRAPRLRFDVVDTGEGIAPEHFAELFEPFRRAPTHQKTDGVGLGLSISRTLAELLGGQLTFRSKLGHGSTFSFTIPVTLCTEPIAPDVEAAHTETTGDGTKILASILLAEDNPDMRLLTTELLSNLGCAYTVAHDGIEAISIIRARAPFDVVLMDCSMPQLSGIEATREIRKFEQSENRAAVPIIALTANAFESDETACRDAGMTGFLRKPFTGSDLAKAIKASLSSH